MTFIESDILNFIIYVIAVRLAHKIVQMRKPYLGKTIFCIAFVQEIKEFLSFLYKVDTFSTTENPT